MKLIWVLFLLIIGVTNTLSAQYFSKKFGEISRSELKMSVYDNDKNAEALVLYDIGKSFFVKSGNNFDVIFERSIRIKILSESGIKYSIVEIPYYKKNNITEEIFKIDGYSYNLEDGKIIKKKLIAENYIDIKISDHWIMRKFLIPNVKIGSIVEFEYQIRSTNKSNLRDWEFQREIPTLYSEYVVELNPFFEYKYILQGANRFDVQESYRSKGCLKQYGSVNYNELVHRFVMMEVPAIATEKFISSVNNYVIRLDFQLDKINTIDGTKENISIDWEGIIVDLINRNDFGHYMHKCKKNAAKIFNVDSLRNIDLLERFEFVVNVLKSNLSWNNYYSKYTTQTPNDFYKNKYGNCAEINLFTVAILNEVGIDAYPLLLSTREHGIIRLDYPYLDFFNYVLIYANINNTEILADATEPLIAFDRIPQRCINDKGLLIKKGEVKWIDLTEDQLTKTEKNISITIEEGYIKADVRNSATEYDAFDLRKKIGRNKEILKNELKAKSYNVNDSSIIFRNVSKTSEPFIFKYSIDNKAEQINNKFYIEPLLNEVLDENPFKEEKRSYAIDMIYPNMKSYNSTIEIPKGYKLEYVPTNSKIKNDLFELDYSSRIEGNKVYVNFYYCFKTSIYSEKNYHILKLYFDRIIKKGSEKVVFVKIQS